MYFKLYIKIINPSLIDSGRIQNDIRSQNYDNNYTGNFTGNVDSTS